MLKFKGFCVFIAGVPLDDYAGLIEGRGGGSVARDPNWGAKPRADVSAFC